MILGSLLEMLVFFFCFSLLTRTFCHLRGIVIIFHGFLRRPYQLNMTTRTVQKSQTALLCFSLFYGLLNSNEWLCYIRESCKTKLIVQSTYDNSNLPLTRTNFRFLSGNFLYNFTLDNSNHACQYVTSQYKQCTVVQKL